MPNYSSWKIFSYSSRFSCLKQAPFFPIGALALNEQGPKLDVPGPVWLATRPIISRSRFSRFAISACPGATRVCHRCIFPCNIDHLFERTGKRGKIVRRRSDREGRRRGFVICAFLIRCCTRLVIRDWQSVSISRAKFFPNSTCDRNFPES